MKSVLPKTEILAKLRTFRYLSTGLVVVIDVLLSLAASLSALFCFRHFLDVPLSAGIIWRMGLVSVLSSCLSFFLCKTYRNIIRYTQLKDTVYLGAAAFLKVVVGMGVSSFILKYVALQDILFVMLSDMFITWVLLVGFRAVLIYVYQSLLEHVEESSSYTRQNMLIYGTTSDSVALSARMANHAKYRVVGFCSYAEHAKRLRINDLEVYQFSTDAYLSSVVNRRHIRAFLFPSTAAVQQEKDRLLAFCEAHHLQVLIAPPVDKLGNRHSVFNVREVEVNDLLDRPEIVINMGEVNRMLHNKSVLVTGAAGSIGSEICRQLVQVGVQRIILFDMAETPLHNIRLEMEEKYPYQQIVPVIGDVRDPRRLQMVFEHYKPTVVFHAAAYKHVPLMEENPCEAIRVNVQGSRNVADACLAFGVEKMIMVSTDKAVNPTNIMGASKRMAEIYVQSLGKAVSEGRVAGRTCFVTTRFGNVLGSNGSVLPRFREQIANGGPVTVTHPEIIRFFMSIPEACRLVLEAGTLGRDNEIFVFDMGEPVRIVDMARRMISLSGLRPDEDIKIEFTGLRPGEKLYEEVLSDEENTLPTDHEKIRIAQARQYDYAQVCESLDEIYRLASDIRIPEMVGKVRQLVPEYVSQNSWLQRF